MCFLDLRLPSKDISLHNVGSRLRTQRNLKLDIKNIIVSAMRTYMYRYVWTHGCLLCHMTISYFYHTVAIFSTGHHRISIEFSTLEVPEQALNEIYPNV